MSQTNSNSARQASLARRIAMSTSGKAALSGNSDRTRAGNSSAAPAVSTAAPAVAVTATTPAPATSYAAPVAAQGSNARKAALARRIAMSQGGKRAVGTTDRTRSSGPATAQAAVSAPVANKEKDCGCGCGGKNAEAAPVVDTTPVVTDSVVTAQLQANLLKKVKMSSTRASALSRRKAMSSKGKSALKGGTVSEASAARAANPNISSRELAQTLREQRSVKGKTDRKGGARSQPTGPGKHRKAQAAAEDQPWKVGVSDTASGQAVTGTMVDRTEDVTGTEASTCRSITGTEYMGADVFKDYCQADAAPAFNRVSATSTATGNTVTGNEVGRSASVTGDEPGTCKNVTGTEYVSANQAEAFCGTTANASPSKFSITETMKGKKVSGNNVGQSGKVTGGEQGADRQLTGSQYMSLGEDTAPNKVNVSKTLSGGSVTGQHIGRSEKVTGDEPGASRNVTGDDYVGAEQFGKDVPERTERKVGVSGTLMGKSVSGTMTDRTGNVTGNEPGTCQSVTGTPYAGEGQARAFCSADQVKSAAARNQKGTTNVGASMTGIQPAVGGVMTGDDKGVCESVTGTPYIGADQASAACPATAATPANSDFPQPLTGAPWQQFSVQAPAEQAQEMQANGGITGTTYEKGHITGPFGMAGGMVTGTEEARFGGAKAAMPEPMPVTAPEVAGRVKSRVSGEGQQAGLKITGDDWDRGDHVTGTEGMSATRRNPTIRGASAAQPMAVENKRNEEVAPPVSRVTGSSGNTEAGSLITYSGGARG